jgi:site-specific recombinase XerD
MVAHSRPGVLPWPGTQRFQDRLRASGQPLRGSYDLRHGTASLLLAEGKSMRVALAQLGHAQFSLT